MLPLPLIPFADSQAFFGKKPQIKTKSHEIHIHPFLADLRQWQLVHAHQKI